MENGILASLLIGCCIGGLLIFGVFFALFGAARKFLSWVFNGISALFDGLATLTDELVVEVSNSINSLTDEQKEEIKNITLTSLYTVTALALYMQEDETGNSKKASAMIIDSIAHNIPNANPEKENSAPDDVSVANDRVKSEYPYEEPSPNSYFSEQGQFRVFLCHAKEDLHIARAFRDALNQYNYDVWLDDSNLLPGHTWEIEIQKAVRTSDIFLVCLSSSWIKRPGYIQKELKIALEEAQNKPEGSIFILPTRFEDCEVPESLRKIQYLDLFRDSRNSFMKLLKTLNLVKTTKVQYH